MTVPSTERTNTLPAVPLSAPLPTRLTRPPISLLSIDGGALSTMDYGDDRRGDVINGVIRDAVIDELSSERRIDGFPFSNIIGIILRQTL